MANLNLEVGVKRALVAFLKEQGASESSASARADAKLSEACGMLSANIRAQKGEVDLSAAFAELKIWALANL